MVWCGVIWCGVIWCSVAWCDLVCYGVLWCDVGQSGALWCAVVWRQVKTIQESAEPFKILLPHRSCFSSSSASGSVMQMKREECEMKGQRAIWQSAALLRSTE